ncbi:LPS-assembly protein LptD [Leeia oryzae]|uniref:LPS-assembly protein LptD n=1 Tax=Leeia oryzae TaxID=356662 RepID=UPI00037DB84B|nr:LPS-assembly protein LptD [Leeia oryzae]
MPQLKPIALAVLALFSLPAFADDASSADTPDLDALSLSPSLSSSSNPADAPIFINANQLQGAGNASLEAEGNVEVFRGDQTLRADWLKMQNNGEQIDAKGNVSFEQKQDKMSGPALSLNTTRKEGVFESPEYELGSRGARGKADQLLFEGQDQYRFKNATYSTCVNPDSDWYLKTTDLSLDYTRKVGEATGAQMVFKGVPIFYLPWMDFPLDGGRKSGWLTPTLRTSGASGAEFSVPYYWNIAPNRDATITPRVISKRGLQVQGEFRYLEPDYHGQLNAEFLPNDKKADRNRYGIKWNHLQQISDWQLGINAEKVSDRNYFNDLSDKLSVTSVTNLPRELWLSKSQNGLSMTARFLKYQTLQDDANSIDPPYAKLPQLTLNWYRPNLGKFDFNLQSDFTAFSHPTKVNGRRLVAYPSLSLPLSSTYAYFTPKLGIHATRYDLSSENNTTGIHGATRILPIFSVDSGLYFERATNMFGKTQTQTLEPRLYYVNIPYRDQSKLPNFDTAEADFSFSQLFSENRYTGSDRINEANQVTASVTSRLINDETGEEQMRLSVGQRYYFRKTQRVTLDNSVIHERSSDILAGFDGQLTDKWHGSAALQFSTKTAKTQKASLDLQYRPGPGKVLNLGYRYDVTPSSEADKFRQLDVSGQWPLGGGWYGVGRWNYSLKDKKPLEVLGGLEYNAGCWAVRMIAQRYVTTNKQRNTAFFVQLEMNDVARLGSNPLQLLKDRISGYKTSQELNKEQAN